MNGYNSCDVIIYANICFAVCFFIVLCIIKCMSGNDYCELIHIHLIHIPSLFEQLIILWSLSDSFNSVRLFLLLQIFSVLAFCCLIVCLAFLFIHFIIINYLRCVNKSLINFKYYFNMHSHSLLNANVPAFLRYQLLWMHTFY